MSNNDDDNDIFIFTWEYSVCFEAASFNISLMHQIIIDKIHVYFQ